MHWLQGSAPTESNRLSNYRIPTTCHPDQFASTSLLVPRYREGQKKSMVRHILATSLTTEYNLFFAFARYMYMYPLSATSEMLFWPYNHPAHRSKRRIKSRYWLTCRPRNEQGSGSLCSAGQAAMCRILAVPAGIFNRLYSRKFHAQHSFYCQMRCWSVTVKIGSTFLRLCPWPHIKYPPPKHVGFPPSSVLCYFWWPQPFVLRAPPSEPV